MPEELMLKREHFPLELNFGGRPFDNSYGLIPPFHSDIVQKGIDLELALSVIGEAVENTLLDWPDYEDFPDDKIPRDETGNFDCKNVQKDEDGIFFPAFPFTGGLAIQKNKISPYGGDNGLRIDKSDTERMYLIPTSVPMSQELMDEYKMTQEGASRDDGYLHVFCQTGWYGHNVDSRRVFYKNLIIALDNAVIKRKYAGKS